MDCCQCCLTWEWFAWFRVESCLIIWEQDKFSVWQIYASCSTVLDSLYLVFPSYFYSLFPVTWRCCTSSSSPVDNHFFSWQSQEAFNTLIQTSQDLSQVIMAQWMNTNARSLLYLLSQGCCSDLLTLCLIFLASWLHCWWVLWQPRAPWTSGTTYSHWPE